MTASGTRHARADRSVVADDVRMVDQQLSEALAAFVGRPGHLEDVSPEASLVEVAGEAAPDLVPRIIAILKELEAEKSVFWQAETETEMGRRVTDWLTTHHPELSSDSIRRVANQFTFGNK